MSSVGSSSGLGKSNRAVVIPAPQLIIKNISTTSQAQQQQQQQQQPQNENSPGGVMRVCLLYTSPSPRD